MSQKAQYAMYQGDELLAVGTKQQLSELLGIKVETVSWYASFSARRKAELCKSGGRYALPLGLSPRMLSFAKRHAQEMNEACSTIVRVTRGNCRCTKSGCDWLGWCEPAYRLAAKRKGES